MSEHYLMACGHTAMAHFEGTDQPVCPICNCTATVEKTNLEGRTARCTCGRSVPSRYGLAFFEHRPAGETDRYYCGHAGWD